MAELVRQQDVDAYVGFHAFGLQESDDADLPVPFPDDFNRHAFLSTHPGRLDITSGGHTHTAVVSVEVWDGPPPGQNRSDWDEVAEAEFESASGQVAVWSMHAGRMDDLITLADSGGSWHVRLTAKGPSKAQQAFQRGVQALAQYIAREGHHRVPRAHAEEIAVEGEAASVVVKLGVWISNTKSRRDKLAQDQLAALRELGVEWA